MSMRTILIAIAVITAVSLIGAAAGLGTFTPTDQGTAPQSGQLETPRSARTPRSGTPVAAGTPAANETPQSINSNDIVRDRQAFILLNPATVRPGSSVGVTGSGFDPGSQIDLTLKKRQDDRGTSIGFVQADKGGSFGGFSFTLPESFNSGSFILVARQKDGSHETSAIGNLSANSPVVTFGTQVGKPGDTIAFSMKGFAPREEVKVYWNSLGAAPVATLQMDEGGGLLSGSIPVPFGAVGNNSFVFVGDKSQSPVTVQFLMLNLYPVASVSSYAAKADTTMTFSGTGFGPKERVRVYLNSVQSSPVDIIEADDQGAFTASGGFIIPFDLKAKNTFILIGEESQAPTTVSFDVLPYTPYAEASTYGGRPGTTIAFYGQGFAREEVVHVYVGRGEGSAGQEVTCALTDTMGSLIAGGSYTIPADARAGKLTFSLVGSKSKAETAATMEVMDAGGAVPANAPSAQAQAPFQCPYPDNDTLSGQMPAPNPTPGAGQPVLTPRAQPPAAGQTPTAQTPVASGTPAATVSPSAAGTTTPGQATPTGRPQPTNTPPAAAATARPTSPAATATPRPTGAAQTSPTAGQSSPPATRAPAQSPAATATPGR